MIIPVLDIKDGQCVSGLSGKRDTYTRLKSIYGEDAVEIATNLRKAGARVLYVADLDRIEDRGDNSKLISEINSIIPVLLDNGAKSSEDVITNGSICTYTIIATETMTGTEECMEVFAENPYGKIILSVDIKDNQLLTNNNLKLSDVITLVNTVRPDYTIVLNLSQIGTQRGNDDAFIRDIIAKTPYTQHIIAGGVSNKSIAEYRSSGIDNFIVGTILHEGTLLDEYKW